MKSINFERFKIGDVIENWEVVSEPFSKPRIKKTSTKEYTINSYYVNCKCLKCKNIFSLYCDNLFTGKSKKCVNCSRLEDSTAENNARWEGFGFIPKTAFERAKWYAERRNIPFSLSIEFLNELFIKQDKKCAISGITLSFKNIHKSQQTASLDRIDSKKYYTEDNVQWIHKHINIMKRELDENYFLNMCKVIVENKYKELK